MKPREDIPQRLVEKLERELESGEKVRWMERPVVGFVHAITSPSLLFGIPFAAMTIFLLTHVIDAAGNFGVAGSGWLLVVFMLPFVLISAALLISPLCRCYDIRSTVYAISDRRAIVIEGGWSRTIRSFPAESLRDIYRKEHFDGTGDVLIDRREYRDSNGDKRTEELGFRRVRDAKEVEAMLKKLASEHQAERGRESSSP